MPNVFECYGDLKSGSALVLARDRADAQAKCARWLGWGHVVAFLTPEELPLFVMSGGCPEFPVVYSRNRVAWDVVRERRTRVAAKAG